MILERDAKLVVDAVNDKDNNWSTIGHLVEDTLGFAIFFTMEMYSYEMIC
jgi:hypothetical protein